MLSKNFTCFVKIQIHEHMRLGISCSTHMLPVGKNNWRKCNENHSILCFPMFQKHKDALIEAAVTKKGWEKNFHMYFYPIKEKPLQ